MTMIYFCGRLDSSIEILNGYEVENINPIAIRGYDDSGNCLSRIYYGVVPVLYTNQVTESGTTYLRSYFDAVLADGTPVVAYTRVTTYSGASGRPLVYPVAVVADAAGRVYAASRAIAAFVAGVATTVYVGSLRKFRRGGDRMPWPEIGGEFRSLALDGSGNLYAGGFEAPTTRYILRKFDADGAELWSVAATSATGTTTKIYSIAHDGSGYIYATGAVEDPINYPQLFGFLNKYNASTGALVWTQPNINTGSPYDQPLCVKISSGGRIYTCGNYLPIVEWDSAGAIVRSSSPLGVLFKKTIASITITGSTIYSMGLYGPVDDPTNFRKYDLDLSLLSETAFIPPDYNPPIFDFSDIYLKVVSDSSGSVYAAAGRKKAVVGNNVYDGAPLNAAYHFHAWDSSGTATWTTKTATGEIGEDKYGNPWPSNQFANDLSAVYRSYADIYTGLTAYTFDGVLAGPDCWYTSFNLNFSDFWQVYDVAVVENTETPALKLGIGLGIPTFEGDRYTQAPGLPIRIALRAPRWLREFVGAYPPPTIYRLWLTGDTGPIELPLGSLQCRRVNDASIALSVVCPGVTVNQINAIALRADGELVIYRGLRFPGGNEQLDEMLRASLTSSRLDQGSDRTSISLSGQSDAPAANPQTRTLRGISYRSFAGGLRRVRCAVDTYLAPGDTADLGAGETMVVRSIVYSISPGDATMEVDE